MLTKIARRPASGPGDLVDLLLECHQRIRHFAALALEAGTRVDASSEQVSQACADVQRYFTLALPLHVADEEVSILPRLRGRSTELDQALEAMEQQHVEHETKLSALLRAAQALGDDPCNPSLKRQLAQAAHNLHAGFTPHLALEEAVVFPALRALSAELQAAILEEFRARRLRG